MLKYSTHFKGKNQKNGFSLKTFVTYCETCIEQIHFFYKVLLIKGTGKKHFPTENLLLQDSMLL